MIRPDGRSMTAAEIGHALVRQVFQRKCLLVVPQCYWTGYECDLLGVGPGMRLIDVEIKMSRADLFADAGKDKWWRRGVSQYSGLDETGGSRYIKAPDAPREWAPRIWKHYLALPASIWTPDLVTALPSQTIGVITVRRDASGRVFATAVKRCRANPNAKPISAADVLDIARLAGLRMWDALQAKETQI